MSIKLMWKDEPVELHERAATADVRQRIARLNTENQKAVASIAIEHSEALSDMQGKTAEEQAQIALNNPELMVAVMEYNEKVEIANTDYILGYVRTILNHKRIDDPALLEAVQSEVSSEFWREQDPGALEEYVDRFREAYKLR